MTHHTKLLFVWDHVTLGVGCELVSYGLAPLLGLTLVGTLYFALGLLLIMLYLGRNKNAS